MSVQPVMLSIRVREVGDVAETIELSDDGIVADVDAHGVIVGITVMPPAIARVRLHWHEHDDT